jgi:nitrogen regulatory protein PII
MDLLVCVVNDESNLNTLLEGFVELGVTGATVLPSQGMGRRLGGVLPATGALQAMLSAARPENTTVFSVIESQEKLDAAIALAQRVCGDLNAAGTGIVFTVPIERAVGLAPPLEVADPDPSADSGGV